MTQPPAGSIAGQSAPANTAFDSGSATNAPSTADTQRTGESVSADATTGAIAVQQPWGAATKNSGSSASSGSAAPSGVADMPTVAVPPAQAAPPTQAAPPAQGTPLVQGSMASAPPAQRHGEAAARPSGSVNMPPSSPAGPATPLGARPTRTRGPRRARLQLRHIDPWTVLKFSCVLAIALFFVWLIVIGVLFGVLDGAGIIDKINQTFTTLQSGNAQPPITARVVFGGAAIIGVVNIVLFIALATVGSVVYNLCADLVGGIEITLSER